MEGKIIVSQSPDLIPIACEYVDLHDKKGIKVAVGIKFANVVTLK